MKKIFHKTRNRLLIFSGEDKQIIELTNDEYTKNAFAKIGFFVIIIFVFCWVSAILFVSHLFENSIILSIIVGLIWGVLITNLYLLLLYTISPAILPISIKKKKNISNTDIINNADIETPFNFSFIFRISLILLLAIIIIQPFNVLFFSPSFEQSNFYAREIRNILSNYPYAWIINLIGCSLFLVPIHWKYIIRNKGKFYEEKQKIENEIIQKSYEKFKINYRQIFENKIEEYNKNSWTKLIPYLNNLEKIDKVKYSKYFDKIKLELISEHITKYEYWADHPFRTVSKNTARNLNSEQDFLYHIYTENN